MKEAIDAVHVKSKWLSRESHLPNHFCFRLLSSTSSSGSTSAMGNPSKIYFVDHIGQGFTPPRPPERRAASADLDSFLLAVQPGCQAIELYSLRMEESWCDTMRYWTGQRIERDGVDAFSLHPHHDLIDVENVAVPMDQGIAVYPYTANREDDLRRLIDWGVINGSWKLNSGCRVLVH